MIGDYNHIIWGVLPKVNRVLQKIQRAAAARCLCQKERKREKMRKSRRLIRYMYAYRFGGNIHGYKRIAVCKHCAQAYIVLTGRKGGGVGKDGDVVRADIFKGEIAPAYRYPCRVQRGCDGSSGVIYKADFYGVLTGNMLFADGNINILLKRFQNRYSVGLYKLGLYACKLGTGAREVDIPYINAVDIF